MTTTIPTVFELKRGDIKSVDNKKGKGVTFVYAVSPNTRFQFPTENFKAVHARLNGEGNADTKVGDFLATRPSSTFSVGMSLGGDIDDVVRRVQPTIVQDERNAFDAYYNALRVCGAALFDDKVKAVEVARNNAIALCVSEERAALVATKTHGVKTDKDVYDLMRHDAAVRTRVMDAACTKFIDGLDIRTPCLAYYDDAGRLRDDAPLRPNGKKHNFNAAMYLAWRVWPFTAAGFTLGYEQAIKTAVPLDTKLSRKTWPDIVRQMAPNYYYSPVPFSDGAGRPVPHPKFVDVNGETTEWPDPFWSYVGDAVTCVCKAHVEPEIILDPKNAATIGLGYRPATGEGGRVAGLQVLRRIPAVSIAWAPVDNADAFAAGSIDDPEPAALPSAVGGKRAAAGSEEASVAQQFAAAATPVWSEQPAPDDDDDTDF